MKLIVNKEFAEKDEYFNKILNRAKSDFFDGDNDSCLTKIRTCLEEVFCYVIEKTGHVVNKRGEMPKMAAQARDILHINMSNELEQKLKQQVQGLISIIDSISALRNIASDAHGVGSNREYLNNGQIILCLNSAVTVKEYFLSVLSKQIEQVPIQQPLKIAEEDNSVKDICIPEDTQEYEMGLFDSLTLIEESATAITVESSNFKVYNDEFLDVVNQKTQKINKLKEQKSKVSIINSEFKLFADDVKRYTTNLRGTSSIIKKQWQNCFLASKVIISNPFMSNSEKQNYVLAMVNMKDSMRNSSKLIIEQSEKVGFVKGFNAELTSEINKLQKEMKELAEQFEKIVKDIEDIEKIEIK